MTLSTSNLTRPTSSGGNQKKYTCSVWLKPSMIRQGSRTILSSDVEDDGQVTMLLGPLRPMVL